VVRIPGYRSRGPSSIPGATRFSEKQQVLTGVHSGPPLWSSGQSSWLQIQRSEFDSWRYQTFWDVVGLEWGPLSLVSTIEELLERRISGSGLENWDYDDRGSAALTTQHTFVHKTWQ
jgi:hypothetical protein